MPLNRKLRVSLPITVGPQCHIPRVAPSTHFNCVCARPLQASQTHQIWHTHSAVERKPSGIVSAHCQAAALLTSWTRLLLQNRETFKTKLSGCRIMILLMEREAGLRLSGCRGGQVLKFVRPPRGTSWKWNVPLSCVGQVYREAFGRLMEYTYGWCFHSVSLHHTLHVSTVRLLAPYSPQTNAACMVCALDAYRAPSISISIVLWCWCFRDRENVIVKNEDYLQIL